MNCNMLPLLLLTLLATAGIPLAAENKVDTFNAYVDSDLCAHLMLGPISPERVECSRSTYKEGSNPVLVRLQDNLVFEVNKEKMFREVVGELVAATGETKEKDGRIKMASIKSIDKADIPPSSPEAQLLDVRNFKAIGANAKAYEKVRHELAMLPYISEYDFISFTMMGGHVILSGWTIRTTNRSAAANVIKKIEGVDRITNNIEILPLGRMDMQVRAGVRANLQRMLSRYFWGNGSDIKIVVKNGNVILLGTVATKADSDLANIQANSVSGAFKIFNMLRVAAPAKKG